LALKTNKNVNAVTNAAMGYGWTNKGTFHVDGGTNKYNKTKMMAEMTVGVKPL
jgi:hypothetical protein